MLNYCGVSIGQAGLPREQNDKSSWCTMHITVKFIGHFCAY